MDFDGTITITDTFLPFIKYVKGRFKFYAGIAYLSPFIIAFQLKLIPNNKLKELFLSHYFKGMSLDVLEANGEGFAREIIPGLIRPEALESIQNHLKGGARIVVVTASLDIWVRPWAEDMGLEYITSVLEEVDGTVSGKLSGENCYGPEKTRRIRDYLSLSDYKEIYCYGDSKGDREMMGIATRSFYRNFIHNGH